MHIHRKHNNRTAKSKRSKPRGQREPEGSPRPEGFWLRLSKNRTNNKNTPLKSCLQLEGICSVSCGTLQPGLSPVISSIINIAKRRRWGLHDVVDTSKGPLISDSLSFKVKDKILANGQVYFAYMFYISVCLKLLESEQDEAGTHRRTIPLQQSIPEVI